MSDKIVVTGAAGLVNQNIVLLSRQNGYQHIVAVYKHALNLALLKQLNLPVECIEADLSTPGDWSSAFQGARCAVVLHTQITSLEKSEFKKNNIMATTQAIKTIQSHHIPFRVHISSSVVDSVATDDYTETKKIEEKMMWKSGWVVKR